MQNGGGMRNAENTQTKFIGHRGHDVTQIFTDILTLQTYGTDQSPRQSKGAMTTNMSTYLLSQATQKYFYRNAKVTLRLQFLDCWLKLFRFVALILETLGSLKVYRYFAT